MGRKNSIDRLSTEVKAYIERRLAEGRMTLDELIADLQATFPEEAVAGELPSRAAVHRYGKKLEQRLAAIRASTDAARLISETTADEKDTRSEAIIALVQSELFESIINLQEAGEEAVDSEKRVSLLAKAAKNIATLSRASVNLKKHQADVARRMVETAKAAAIAGAQAEGLTPEQAARIGAAVASKVQIYLPDNGR